MSSVLWLRRDLRRGDHPALAAAAAAGTVLPLFVLDPRLWAGAGPARRAWLAATLRATSTAYEDRLCVRVGDPAEVVPRVAREVSATQVHVTGETTPFGRRRDEAVATALRDLDVAFEPTGSPYAVPPGAVRTQEGTPYQVFTPFSRAWRGHGWSDPVEEPAGLTLADAPSDAHAEELLDRAVQEAPGDLPPAGEGAALARWSDFVEQDLASYETDRDRPDLDRTSRLSPYLKLGVLHPRTLLADLAGRSDKGSQSYVTELAWREFYADVLWHQPASAWQDLRSELAQLRYDETEDLDTWQQGMTGFPIVDAGMRQLLAEGWMHNRLRMITGSFLTKDLHVWWPVGARHFLEHLIDGDLASNNHGWQWVAGTGTDAAPYFRVFNPVTQGKRFDPEGDYVRRWVPELRHLPGPAVHEPWRHPEGYAHDYPQRIVDHAEERVEALARYKQARG